MCLGLKKDIFEVVGGTCFLFWFGFLGGWVWVDFLVVF